MTEEEFGQEYIKHIRKVIDGMIPDEKYTLQGSCKEILGVWSGTMTIVASDHLPEHHAQQLRVNLENLRRIPRSVTIVISPQADGQHIAYGPGMIIQHVRLRKK